MNDLTGALCVGQPALFESTNHGKHEQAAAICADCPVRAACLEVARRESKGYIWNGSGPVGTWGGVLFGANGKHKKPVNGTANRTPVPGKIKAARPEVVAHPEPGLAPVLSEQNERLSAS